MKIGVDVTFIARDLRGMGRYTRSILSRMLRAEDKEIFLILSRHENDRRKIREMFPQGKFTFLRPSGLYGLDVVWYPWNRIDFLPGCPKVVTIHDMAPFSVGTGKSPSENCRDRERFHSAAKVSDKIITCSEFSRREICSYLDVGPEKVEVVYHGVDQRFCPLHLPQEEKIRLLERYTRGFPFILFVGTVEKRKNLEGLLEAFAILKEKYSVPHKLVVAGERLPGTAGGGYLEKILKRLGLRKTHRLKYAIERLRLADEVIWLGALDDRELVYLYNLTEIFVLPSHYEGFGLPLLEAMACGLPCLAARSSSLPEVGGPAVEYFDPKSSEDLASSLWRILSDEALCARLRESASRRARTFSWEDTTGKIIRILEETTNALPVRTA